MVRPGMKITKSIGEVAAVIATALLHPVCVDLLHQRAVFIGTALCLWGLYFIWQPWKDEGALRRWGFRREGLAPAFLGASGFAAAALAVMVVVGVAQGTLAFPWQMLVLLILYPIWGMFQQLLVQGVFVRTVTESASGLRPKVAATIVAAVLFGAVHLPELRLALAAAMLGVVFTAIYLRWRNLWPLGLYHGWLGVFYYYWVLGRDPWREMFVGHA
jgi:hypothetical protein